MIAERFNKSQYGGNRNTALERDKFSCVKCGLTQAEHKEKYGKDLHVDHIDNRGMAVPDSEKNNALDNLQTLCVVCHAKKDKWGKLTIEQVNEIRDLSKRGMKQVAIALRFNITPMHVSYIVRNKRRVLQG